MYFLFYGIQQNLATRKGLGLTLVKKPVHAIRFLSEISNFSTSRELSNNNFTGSSANRNEFVEMNSLAIVICILSSISLVHSDEKTGRKFKLVKEKEIIGMTNIYGKLLNELIQPKQASQNEILDQIKMIHSDMQQLEGLLHIQYNDMMGTLNSLPLLTDVQTLQDRFHRLSSYINYQYYKFISRIDSQEKDSIENVTLLEFAKESTGQADHHLPNYLREFIELIIPSNRERGFLNLYSKYILDQERKHEWCNNKQSLNDIIYKSYRYTMETVMKGHLVILQSYAIRSAFDQGNFTSEMRFTKEEYEKAAHSITENLNNLASQGSTKLRRCDPSVHKRGETYLEMEKLFQGILVSKLNTNAEHTGKYDCDHYQDDGAAYHPYERIKSDGDWKCYGLMYKCFESYAIDICKPTTSNRRFDGFTADNPRAGFFHPWEPHPDNMGNLTNCRENKFWTYLDWNNPNYWGIYDLGPCRCICDDIEHPKTLRKFSTEIVSTDYKDNMVMTGVRLVNIDNIIHIDIQQGKLSSFGFIDPSTIHWKSRDEVLKEYNNSLTEPITLSYRRRGITLDALHAEVNQVLLGAKFQLDSDGNVVLSGMAANFEFATGDIDLNHVNEISYNSTRIEIELDKPHEPTLSFKNAPEKEDHGLIKFQTSDWMKDAAQTTVPYLDIQEVITDPPTILKGIGLRYRGAPGFGGFIGFELYSHDYVDLINYDVTLNS
ncbi:uncharacterized protein [Fopius arisanus]|uniref:Uncharacterized protein n=2 Tax=Fopius arisanus TaxID=64838 RepID=A0A9R1TR34_9HYME|nr:PREDICTED: uncharacterized protein LOC105273467 [Fopius arisanus]